MGHEPQDCNDGKMRYEVPLERERPRLKGTADDDNWK